MTTLVLIAKECVPGRVKTRLTPPLTPEHAAALAAACLDETLTVARAVPADRHILYFDGRPPAGVDDFEVVPQVDGTLDVRIAALFDRTTDRTLLIGMDTPQLDAAVLTGVLQEESGAAAWLGHATDGGFWALGMDRPRGDLVQGVPMSRHDSGARQLRRLEVAGLPVRLLPTLTDLDEIDGAREVAALLPGSRFAALLAEADSRDDGARDDGALTTIEEEA